MTISELNTEMEALSIWSDTSKGMTNMIWAQNTPLFQSDYFPIIYQKKKKSSFKRADQILIESLFLHIAK